MRRIAEGVIERDRGVPLGYTKPSETRYGGDRARAVSRVLLSILALNVSVAVAKMVYGWLSGSISMRADGFHSLFDGTSNLIGLLGMAIAGRPADPSHPYGHSKYETYASAAIGAMLMLAAYNIGSDAIGKLLAGTPEPPRVDAGSFAVMLGTLAVNFGVTIYERRVGRRLGSAVLIADASHTGSDILVSLGVIAGLVAVRLGYPVADPVIAVLVAGAIVATALRILASAGVTLSDSARLDPAKVCDAALSVPGVLGCHSIRTRGSESDVYVDLHIQVDSAQRVGEGHSIAEAVERAVSAAFEEVVDVIVHLEPFDEYQRSKTDAQSEVGSKSKV